MPSPEEEASSVRMSERREMKIGSGGKESKEVRLVSRRRAHGIRTFVVFVPDLEA